MADALNKYSTKTDYEAATHSSGYSEVSYIADRDITVYDGCNVETTRSPNVGDALWIDSAGKKHFYKGSTVNHSVLTANGQYFVGAVSLRHGNKICILHKDEANSYRVANGFAWEIKNISYGTSNSITFQQRGRTAAGATTYTDYTVGTCNFTPSDIDDAVSKIDTWLQANPGGSSVSTLILDTYNWRCIKLNSGIWVTTPSVSNQNVYTGSVVNSSLSGGIAGSQNMWSLAGRSIVGEYTLGTQNFIRADGCSTWLTLLNQSRYRQLNQSVNSPRDAIKTGGVYKESDFNNTTVLKAYYGTYSAYLDAMMMKTPNKYNTMPKWMGTSKDFCTELAKYSIPNTTGTQYLFPAAQYSQTVKAHPNISVDGLNAGAWYIPGMDEIREIFMQMNVSGTDPINTAMINSNSAARPLNITRWSIWPYDYSRSCIYHNGGYTDATSFLNSLRIPLVAWLDI